MQILLVDDDLIDAQIFEKAFYMQNQEHKITHASSGRQALELLSKDWKPDLIFLDINMPVMSGIELLETLSNKEKTRTIPKVMLSTSNNQQDLDSCYNFNICGYFVKPVDFNEFVELISIIDNYWSHCQLISPSDR